MLPLVCGTEGSLDQQLLSGSFDCVEEGPAPLGHLDPTEDLLACCAGIETPALTQENVGH